MSRREIGNMLDYFNKDNHNENYKELFDEALKSLAKFSDIYTKLANLPKGPKGDPGEKGETGEKGDKGDSLKIDGIVNTIDKLPTGSTYSTYVVGEYLYFRINGIWKKGPLLKSYLSIGSDGYFYIDGVKTNAVADNSQTLAAAKELTTSMIDELVFENRNLIEDISQFDYHSNDGANFPVEKTKSVDGNLVVRMNKSTAHEIYLFSSLLIPTILGETYTFQLKVKPTETVNLKFNTWIDFNKSAISCNANTWTTLSVTFKAESTETRFPFLYSDNITSTNKIEVKEPKMELGSKVTPFSLSLEEQNNLYARKSDTTVSPDDYEGNDFEKVQQAISYAEMNDKGVRFTRIYNITGHEIVLKKPYTRQALMLFGNGGGIRKDDAGFIFTTDGSRYVGDISSIHMKYYSVEGAGTKVWNSKGATGIIRHSSTNDSYVNVDTIVDGVGGYSQTVRVTGCTIAGGKGWAFQFDQTYDVNISDNVIEHRQNGIRNTKYTNTPCDNSNLRITNNVIEGLTGQAIELGSCFGSLIQGNYFEYNEGGDLDLTKSTNTHKGLSIISNNFYLTQAQKTNNSPAIIINVSENSGINSIGNFVDGVLYHLISANNKGKVIASGDVSNTNQFAIGNIDCYFDLAKKIKTPRAYKQIVGDIPFIAGETKRIPISFDGLVQLDGTEIYTIPYASGSKSHSWAVKNVSKTVTEENNVYVIIKNEHTEDQLLYMHVLATKFE